MYVCAKIVARGIPQVLVHLPCSRWRDVAYTRLAVYSPISHPVLPQKQ